MEILQVPFGLIPGSDGKPYALRVGFIPFTEGKSSSHGVFKDALACSQGLISKHGYVYDFNLGYYMLSDLEKGLILPEYCIHPAVDHVPIILGRGSPDQQLLTLESHVVTLSKEGSLSTIPFHLSPIYTESSKLKGLGSTSVEIPRSDLSLDTILSADLISLISGNFNPADKPDLDYDLNYSALDRIWKPQDLNPPAVKLALQPYDGSLVIPDGVTSFGIADLSEDSLQIILAPNTFSAKLEFEKALDLSFMSSGIADLALFLTEIYQVATLKDREFPWMSFKLLLNDSTMCVPDEITLLDTFFLGLYLSTVECDNWVISARDIHISSTEASIASDSLSLAGERVYLAADRSHLPDAFNLTGIGYSKGVTPCLAVMFTYFDIGADLTFTGKTQSDVVALISSDDDCETTFGVALDEDIRSVLLWFDCKTKMRGRITDPRTDILLRGSSTNSNLVLCSTGIRRFNCDGFECDSVTLYTPPLRKKDPFVLDDDLDAGWVDLSKVSAKLCGVLEVENIDGHSNGYFTSENGTSPKSLALGISADSDYTNGDIASEGIRYPIAPLILSIPTLFAYSHVDIRFATELIMSESTGTPPILPHDFSKDTPASYNREGITFWEEDSSEYGFDDEDDEVDDYEVSLTYKIYCLESQLGTLQRFYKLMFASDCLIINENEIRLLDDYGDTRYRIFFSISLS